MVNTVTNTTATFPLVTTAGAAPTATWVHDAAAGKWNLQLARLLPSVEYSVTVKTTNLPDATFDGDVLVTLTGSEGVTEELRLPADTSKAYNPGQVCLLAHGGLPSLRWSGRRCLSRRDALPVPSRRSRASHA